MIFTFCFTVIKKLHRATVDAWNIFSGQQKKKPEFIFNITEIRKVCIYYFCAFCFQRLEIMQGVLKAKVECTCKMSLSWTIYNITKRERSFCTTAFCWSHWSLKWKLLRLKQKQNVLCILAIFFEGKKVRNWRLQLTFRADHFHQSVTQKSHI